MIINLSPAPPPRVSAHSAEQDSGSSGARTRTDSYSVGGEPPPQTEESLNSSTRDYSSCGGLFLRGFVVAHVFPAFVPVRRCLERSRHRSVGSSFWRHPLPGETTKNAAGSDSCRSARWVFAAETGFSGLPRGSRGRSMPTAAPPSPSGRRRRPRRASAPPSCDAWISSAETLPCLFASCFCKPAAMLDAFDTCAPGAC